MKVVAIMPTFNQSEFIEEAIESVVHQVDQLIIVDDGSTDSTWDEVLSYAEHKNVYTVRLKTNQGTATAINEGFAWTTGDLVTWVSSDNVHTMDWREKLEAAFEPDVGVVYSAYNYGIGGRKLFKTYLENRLIGNRNCYYGPSFLVRHGVWDEVGDHRGKISHDYDHWLRVEETCRDMGLRIVGIPDVLCDYRVHNKRVTVTRRHEYDAPHWQAEAKKRRYP